MNKSQKLKSLNEDDLFKLVESLLQKLGYKNISKKNPGIFLTNYTTPLGNESHGVFIFNHKISGQNEQSISLDKDIQNKALELNVTTIVLISNGNISNNSRKIFDKLNLSINYIDQDRLISIIDQHQPNYWHHSDTYLLDYESYFVNQVMSEIELKKLKIFNDKYQKLIDIFIEPRINQLQLDLESNIPSLKKTDLASLAKASNPGVISGDAGTGKTTILKRIGKSIIDFNRKRDGKKKKLPILINQIDLIDSKMKVIEVIQNKLKEFFEDTIQEIFNNYDIVVLLDSIDEFDESIQDKIMGELSQLNIENGINFFVASRSADASFIPRLESKIDTYVVEKFDQGQIKKFISLFFSEQSRGEELLDSLRDNRILEQLPITPLSLSLMAILFEEQDFEIPATITDIYHNFNQLLLGKAFVKSRSEFIDITFKERIVSLYAFEVLNREHKKPMTRSEFYDYFEKYFADKTLKFERESLPLLLDDLISHSGILLITTENHVRFKHDSFMEYYAAVEIFKHKRNREVELVQNLFDANWQNTAVFYAGMSRDMTEFLEDVITKVEKANTIHELFAGIGGMGYILQALYQTDNSLRSKGVVTALNKNLELHEFFKKIISDESVPMFKNLNLPIAGSFSLLQFYENFNSVTLKVPMLRVYDEMYQKYKEGEDTTIGFNALTLACVLRSKRIGEERPFEDLLYNSKLLDNPLLHVIAEVGLYFDGSDNFRELAKEIGKHKHKLREALNHVNTSTKKLRFSPFDQIIAKKRVKLISEGKTDSEIIQHAYMILTNNKLPYWTITPAGNQSGGATELHKCLMSSHTILDDDQIVIGIFDNDAKGIQEFNGLKTGVFEKIEGSERIKKHIQKRIYGLKLPIFPERHTYKKNKQEFNFFAIEHYFSDSYLEQNNMLKSTDIEGVFEINSSLKSRFSKNVLKERNPKIFVNFIHLFREIDRICKVETDYIN